MVSSTIIESEMNFVIGNQDYFFYIEKSKTYQKIQEDLKIAEFLYLRFPKGKRVINIVEAKKSTPHVKNENRFNEYIEEVTQKFVNTFYIYIASILGRHKFAVMEMSKELINLDLSEIDFSFVLVIKTAKIDWLPAIKYAINKQVRNFINNEIWVLSSNPVIVLNAELAMKKGIIN